MVIADVTYLHERLHYDGETGKLFWKPHPSMPPKWNGRFSGREAFTAISNGYCVGRLDGRKMYAHRVIYAMRTGLWPVQIDHVDHVRTNNRMGNLAATDNARNGRNVSLSRRNTSGVCGVQWDAVRDRWHARIHFQGKTYHLGRYASKAEATVVRKRAERSFGFHLNHGAA